MSPVAAPFAPRIHTTARKVYIGGQLALFALIIRECMDQERINVLNSAIDV